MPKILIDTLFQMSSCVILLIMLPVFVWGQYCPLPEAIAPSCVCRNFGDGPMLQCNGLMNAEELIPPIKVTDGVDMFALAIMDSALLYIPDGLFKNTNYKRIMFSNTHLMSLSESDLAFEGLEDHLEELRAFGASYITQWDWQQLRDMRKLSLLDVHDIAMYSLDHEFPALKSMKHLGISKAEISFLHPKAFHELPNLDMLILKDNEISEMKRSMLPEPALHLHLLQLSGNKLSSLPKDMFEGMPNLKELYLADNNFVSLDEDVFSTPMQQLQLLNLKGNKIRCDCRLRWMVDVKKPLYLEAECDVPAALRGQKLKYLVNNVLWC